MTGATYCPSAFPRQLFRIRTTWLVTSSPETYGKLVGGKGYISQKLLEMLLDRDVQLITKIKWNLKYKLVRMNDKLLLRKRWIIETINRQLKNILQIERTRHRSPLKFLANLVAYGYQEKKRSLMRNVDQPASLEEASSRTEVKEWSQKILDSLLFFTDKQPLRQFFQYLDKVIYILKGHSQYKECHYYAAVPGDMYYDAFWKMDAFSMEASVAGLR